MTHRCSWTFCFSLGTRKGDKQLTTTVLVLLDRVSRGVSCFVTDKGALEHMSQFVCASMDWWVHADLTIRRGQSTVKERRGHSAY